MTNEEAINQLKSELHGYGTEKYFQSIHIAIDSLEKLSKIEKIIEEYNNGTDD